MKENKMKANKMKANKPMTTEEYVINGGTLCPACYSDEVESTQPMQVDRSICWQSCMCNTCKQEWVDQYKLVGWVGKPTTKKTK